MTKFAKFKNKLTIATAIILTALFLFFAIATIGGNTTKAIAHDTENTEKNFVKWVDFNADTKSLKSVLAFCKEYNCSDCGEKPRQEFSKVLAYLACKNGNKFGSKSTNSNLIKLRAHINKGGTIEEIFEDNKYFNTYLDGFRAIFDGLVGYYTTNDSANEQYGIKAFFPIANGFWFSHYDDFGAKRSFGFNRKHLGHDIFGSTGAPIVAIEGGIITELGWNRYGGWRIGIKSHDTQRYYYYAHLKKNAPFATGLAVGDTVIAGQVIGFLGNTGYSNKENTNLKTGEPHLHLGLQLIFHPSQEDGNGEIWIDLYAITRFLLSERAKVIKCETKKEWVSKNQKQPVKSNEELLKEFEKDLIKY